MPNRTCDTEYLALDSLMQQFDYATFDGLNAVLGCPDCADGGAEYLELVRDGKSDRVTFEYGNEPPTFTKVVSNFRQVLADLDIDCQ